MKYKELVDDIQIQFKSHNESVKTQNPYWILFRLITEINAIRDELLQKLKTPEDVPEWMILTSPNLSATISNSGNLAYVFDDFKFAMFTLPSAYPIFKNKGIMEAVSAMRQLTIFIEPRETLMLRIKAEDENLKEYSYGFIENGKLFVFPIVDKVHIRYIPMVFGGGYEDIVITTVITAPDFIIKEARTRVVESVIIQKQIPEDDRPDMRDLAGGTGTQNRQ